MATLYRVTVGPVGRVQSGKGWPVRCACGWTHDVVGTTRTAREGALKWARGHLRRDHGVDDAASRTLARRVLLTALDDRASSAEERRTFRELVTGPIRTRLRDHPRTWLTLAAWALALLGILAAVVETNKPPGTTSVDDTLIVPLLVVMFGGIGLVLFAASREVAQARDRRITDYLAELGYADRNPVEPVRDDNRESDAWRYPVTDGVYDPGLYGQRGGYRTKERMETFGFDNYDVYRNNFEEAD